jgi:ribonuclease Z
MELLFLGTSGCGITPNRSLPAQLIDRQILFDCGEGTLARLLDLAISPEEIQAIFLTHSHADHFLGLISFLWHLAFYSPDIDFTQTRRSPPLYVPVGMRSVLEQIFRLTSSAFDHVHFTPHIIELPRNFLKPLEIILQDREYSIEWIPTAHEPPCYAYKINHQVVLSGDTHPFPELDGYLQGCHTLVHEATFFDSDRALAHRLHHSTPIDAAEIAKKAGVSQLLLTHLPRLSMKAETEFLANAVQIFSPIQIAHDRDRIIIPD